tara:strand:- start:747 stop:1415 length:669 start_codon:yes stop_codon:yes gene_type:complete
MAEEAIVEETVEEVVDEAVTETPEAVVEETTEAVEDTKTLLSDDEGDGEAAGSSDVPETYEFVAPEGYEVNEHIQAQLDTFSETAKAAGLTQEQYQTVVTGEVERATGLLAQASQAYTDRVTAWADATRADKLLGGEKLAENLGTAKAAMDKFGNDELKQLFDAPTPDNPNGLGIGNHPEVIRLLHRVGSLLSEDDLITSEEEVGGAGSLERMYPSMFKEAS